MPFVSRSQERACFAKRRAGQAKGWDCKEWASHTNQKALPEHAPKSAGFVVELAQRAARLVLGR